MTVEAQLLRDLAGGKAGDCVTVKLYMFDDDGLALCVEKDDGPQMLYPARLLVGNNIEGNGSLQLRC